ncbi:MAG: APC family permease [Pseudolysinimonas sp.]
MSEQTSTHHAGVLRRNALGVAGIVFLVMAAVAPLTGMIVVSALAIALGNGGGMPASFLIVAAVLILFAVGYAQMSKQLVNAGGFYAFVVKGLGRTGGLIAGFIATMGYNFFVAGAIGTSGFFMSTVIGGWGLDLPWYFWGMLSIVIAFILAVRGIDISAKVLGVSLVLEVAILLVFDFSVLFQHGFSFEAFSPQFVFTGGLGAGLLLAATGFLGFEATSLFSEEARNPLKTIPRATYVAVCMIAFVLAFSTWAVVSATGVAQAQKVATAHLESGDLIFFLSNRYLGSVMTTVMEVLLLVSLFAALLAFHNASGRYLFSLGRAGILPKGLSKTTHRGVPRNALLTNLIFAAVVAGLFLVFLPGLPPIASLVPSMIGFGTLCVLALQMLAALAIVVHFRVTKDTRWWKTFIAPGIGFLGLLAIVIMAITNFPLVAGSDSILVALLPVLLAVAAVAGVIYGFYLKNNKPQVYANLSNDLENFEVLDEGGVG